jgi:hypothetical protein
MAFVESAIVGQRVRTLQIIIGTMFAGAAAFLVVTLVIEPPKPPSGAGILTYVALAYGVVAVVVRLVLPPFLHQDTLRRLVRDERELADLGGPAAGATVVTDVDVLCNRLTIVTIITGALIEGAALLAIVAYLIDRTRLSLAAAGVLLVILAAGIPTRAGARSWLDVQQRRLDAARAARP